MQKMYSNRKTDTDSSEMEEELLETEDLLENEPDKPEYKPKQPAVNGSCLIAFNSAIFVNYFLLLEEKTKRRSPVYTFFATTEDPSRMECRSCMIKITVR